MTDRKEIERLIDRELKEANEKYPLFHSPHEAYAVLQEEVEELEYDMEVIKEYMVSMWRNVKNDCDILAFKDRVEFYAMGVIQEAIQVSAMCKKIGMSNIYNDK